MSSYVNTKESRGIGAIAAADHHPRSKLIARPKPGYAGVPVKIGTRGEIIRPVAAKAVTVVRTPHGPRRVALKSRPAVYPSAGYIRSGDQQALGMSLLPAGMQLYKPPGTTPTTITAISPITQKLTTISKTTSEPSRCADGYTYKAGYYRKDSTGKQVWVNGGCIKTAVAPAPAPSPVDRLKELTITPDKAPATTTTVVTTPDEVVATTEPAPRVSPTDTSAQPVNVVISPNITVPKNGGSSPTTVIDRNGNDVIVPSFGPSGFMGTGIPTSYALIGAGVIAYLLLKNR